jgi:hypothetical protein
MLSWLFGKPEAKPPRVVDFVCTTKRPPAGYYARAIHFVPAEYRLVGEATVEALTLTVNALMADGWRMCCAVKIDGGVFYAELYR